MINRGFTYKIAIANLGTNSSLRFFFVEACFFILLLRIQASLGLKEKTF